MNPFDELDLIGIITAELYSAHGYSYIIFDHEDTVSIDIEWGDWKHNHRFLELFMEERGFDQLIEEVTDEDGSDTYSATHVYKLRESEKINDDMEIIKGQDHTYWIYDTNTGKYYSTCVSWHNFEEDEFIERFNKIGFSLYGNGWFEYDGDL